MLVSYLDTQVCHEGAALRYSSFHPILVLSLDSLTTDLSPKCREVPPVPKNHVQLRSI